MAYLLHALAPSHPGLSRVETIHTLLRLRIISPNQAIGKLKQITLAQSVIKARLITLDRAK